MEMERGNGDRKLLEDVGSHFDEHWLGFVSDDIFRVCYVEKVNLEVQRNWSLQPHVVLQSIRL